MKNKKIHTAANLLLGLVMMMSCSDNRQDERGLKIPEEGLPVYATLDTRAIPADLTCQMYVFSKTSGSASDYSFIETVDLTGQLPLRMEFDSNEVSGKEYRFLFVAHPESNSKLTVTPAANWQDLKISTTDQQMEENYYYGILDKTGQQIATEGSIHGNMSRMVGQMVLDIFRIDEEFENQVSIEPWSYMASVLDRVHEIKVEYHNLTKDISFDADGNIVEGMKWETPFEKTYNPTLSDTLQVYLPQEDNGLFVSRDTLNGSVRIKGICGFMSGPNVRVKYTFKYYGTTPINEVFYHVHGRECYGIRIPTICGFRYLDEHKHTAGCYTDGELTCTKEVHVHTVDCYAPEYSPTCERDVHVHDENCFDDQQTVVLNLPEVDNNTELLSIIPNMYTVNMAGIRRNRIIDLNQPVSFEFKTKWENEN